MPTAQLEVIVVGGGIGGLTAAIALRRGNHAVTVYEKSSLSHEIGQGITIGPPGGRILREYGLEAQDARSVEYLGVHVNYADTLEPMMPRIDLSGDIEKYGIHMYTAYRPDLHRALLNLARDPDGDGPPVKVCAGTDVSDLDCGNGSIVLANGDKVTADLVVAADGVHSKAAAHILAPHTCPPHKSSEASAFRFTVPTQRLLDHPDTAHLLSAGNGHCSFNVAPEGTRWLVRYACRDNELQNFTLLSTRSRQEEEEEKETPASLRSSSDRESLIQEMYHFHPSLRKVAQMASEVLPRWRCTTREPLERLQKDRMVVIGDAAHPMYPRGGMGAVSAIEDAALLGALLAGALMEVKKSAAWFKEPLELFESLRKPRVAAYKYYADVPYFRQAAVTAQREKVDVYMKREDQPQRK